MTSDRALLAQREGIVDFAAKRRLPALYAYREFVEGGGLASYARTIRRCFDAPPPTWTRFSREPSPLTSPSSKQPSSSWFNLKTAKANSHWRAPMPLLMPHTNAGLVRVTTVVLWAVAALLALNGPATAACLPG